MHRAMLYLYKLYNMYMAPYGIAYDLDMAHRLSMIQHFNESLRWNVMKTTEEKEVTVISLDRKCICVEYSFNLSTKNLCRQKNNFKWNEFTFENNVKWDFKISKETRLFLKKDIIKLKEP